MANDAKKKHTEALEWANRIVGELRGWARVLHRGAEVFSIVLKHALACLRELQELPDHNPTPP